MMVMSEETTTLMGREEVQGGRYPLWIERVLFLAALLLFIFYSTVAVEAVGHSIIGPLVGYVVFPLCLLAGAELLGRFAQGMLSS